MKLSKLIYKVRKETIKDEQSINAQLLIRANFVDKVCAGVYTMLPFGLRTAKKIENIIREEIIKKEGQEISMPALHPKANWIKTGRWDTMTDLFKLENYALGATHEEIVVPLVSKYLETYKELPFSLFQFQTKFRNELRAKSGLLRTKEFVMKDWYSFHATEECLDKFYDESIEVYNRIFKRLNLKSILTYASGGSFSKYSHEFQVETPAGEDMIYYCSKCNIAVNKEIEHDKCPKCGNTDLQEKKAIEIGNIFKLMTKFCEPFDLKYRNKEGEDKLAIMGCYGIGIGRLMGAVVETSHDDNGIIWPESIAPFDYYLISIKRDKEAEEIYGRLTAKGYDVLFDDRDESPGKKFSDADLIGIPKRIVISEKTGDKVELKERNKKDAELINISDLC